MPKRWWSWIVVGLVVLLVGGAVVSALGSGRDGLKDAGGGSSAASGAGSKPSTPIATDSSGVSGEKRAATGASESVPVGAPTAVADGANAGGAVALGGLAAPGAPTRVVKTAEITLEVKRGKLADTVLDVTTLVGGAGVKGFVASSQTASGRSVLTLRVPAAQFESFMKELQGFGKVKAQSLRGDDVTAQYTDLEGRLRNARAQEAVLLNLMGQARTVQDSITVQQSLSQVQQQIEELEGQRRLLDDQSSFGTITATFAVRGATLAAGAGGGSTLSEAWDQAAGVSLNVIGGTLVLVGALLPLAVLALLGLAGWFVVRRHRSGAPTLAP